MPIVSTAALLLVDGFALMVLAAVWVARRDAIKRDMRRVAARVCHH